MGNRGESKKFSFPLPRRRKVVKHDDQDDARSQATLSSRSTHSNAQEWATRHENPSTSKAHRVLGTSDPLYRSMSNQSSIPPSPGFMSITVSEASYGSHVDDRVSAAAHEHGGGYLQRPGMSRRPSSNVLGRAYSKDGRNGSDASSVTRLHPQTSNSTLRSHYDAKSSPLAISQQTSDSAVRDRALRRGHPPVVTDQGYEASPLSPAIANEAKRRDAKKGKPARLDLSKLFPKPKTGNSSDHGSALLSPAKMVSSPSALSISSDYFPRPMTREPTPLGGQVKKTSTRRQSSQPPSSPVRRFQPDEYDNAKVNVRRPPKGVQHWFDALDEDSDEASEGAKNKILAPKAYRPNGIVQAPICKPATTERKHFPQYLNPNMRNDTFSHEDIVDVSRLTSPSQFSVNSLLSSKTKESALSKTNLQDSSVLSFSSSEDENEGGHSKSRRYTVRKSLDMNDDSGEIVIGQARAYQMAPGRRPSGSKMSTRTMSTSAATIEVMYTPEPPYTPQGGWGSVPRNGNHASSRRSSQRSSHMRQPSVIPEDEDYRPRTAINRPHSPSLHSTRSGRTSTSEPQTSRDGSHKYMAVTAEEEALLELMRRKRAAMAKLEDPSALDLSQRQDTPIENAHEPYRTSGFLSMEASPVRMVETKATRKSSANSVPLLQPPTSRGRSTRPVQEQKDFANETTPEPQMSSTIKHSSVPHTLPTPTEFSPLQLFHPTSPTATDRASPLPSPVTPGLRNGEADVAVKVANSDTSNEIEDIPSLDSGIIGMIAENSKSDARSVVPQQQRRRTASSSADAPFPMPTTLQAKELSSVSEASSRAPSVNGPSKTSRRTSAISSSNGLTASRQNSVHSNNSRTSSYSRDSSQRGSEKRSSRYTSTTGPAKLDKRSSISQDVLAAWNSLGGTY